MKFMQAKAVLFLMLLFFSISVWSQTIKVYVPVKFMSSLLMDPSSEEKAYLYYILDNKYGGVYVTRIHNTYVEAKERKTVMCIISDISPKCKGFKTGKEALQNAYNILKDNGMYDCKIEERFNLVNCRESKVEDSTGGDGSTSSGTGSPVDNGNGNSNNDEKPPKPDPNQCGKTILGVWVPMPCDKVDDTETPADNSGSGNGSGSGSDGGSGGGSDSGSADGQGSDSNSDENNGAGGGNTDYVPPKEPSCSPSNPSRNMCKSDKMVSHGDYVYSCVKDKDGKPEYYNFWVSKGVGNIEYCDDGSAYVTVKEGDTYNITIYNNYNSKDDALNADKNSSSTDDIYEKFDRDRRNKERERDKNNSSANTDNNAASQPSSGANGAGASNDSVGGSTNGSGLGSGSCEEREDTLGCVPVGSESDVNKAIDGAIDGIGDSDLGIGEKEISINSFKKSSDFVESGTCPPPKTVKILRSTHEISYQSFCDAALKIRPFVIFMAMFVAFTIVYIAILNKD